MYLAFTRLAVVLVELRAQTMLEVWAVLVVVGFPLLPVVLRYRFKVLPEPLGPLGQPPPAVVVVVARLQRIRTAQTEPQIVLPAPA